MADRPGADQSEMPFLDHLEELRFRIIRSLMAVGIAMIVGVALAFLFPIVDTVLRQAGHDKAGHELVFHATGLTDAFALNLRAAFVIAVILALPVITYQIWAFLAPGLYDRERRISRLVIGAAFFLFLLGAALAYFVVVPLAVPWLLGFYTPHLQPMLMADDYFGFTAALVIGFGACFQLPLVLIALISFGMLKTSFLTKYRRHSVVVILLVSELATPGDLVFSTLALAIPLYLFFEISILIGRTIERNREREAAAALAE